MKSIVLLRNRLLKAVLPGLLIFCFHSFAWAGAPMVKTQVPGYWRMMVGPFEVTALYDGFVDLDAKLLTNATDRDVRELFDRMFVGYPKMQVPVIAYLINTGSKLVLVDAGYGKSPNPAAGKARGNIRASGYNPAQIDAVLISHLHSDHVGGLLDAEGKRAFPNAVVYVAKAESDFWLSPASEAKARAEHKKYFRMARDLAAPYIATGRWKTFNNGDTPVPGIKAILIPGHTPGHTAYEVGAGKESLIITGDMIHSLAVQFQRPDVAVAFDTDQREAVSTRLALFKSAAERKALIAGMHLPFPGIGRIREDGKNSYTFVPLEYTPVRENAKGSTY